MLMPILDQSVQYILKRALKRVPARTLFYKEAFCFDDHIGGCARIRVWQPSGQQHMDLCKSMRQSR